MKHLLPILSIFLIAAPQSKAQSTPEALIDRFFESYLSIGSSEALDELYATNPWMAQNQEAVENLKSQLSEFLPLVGDYHGRELVVRKQLGDSFVLISYLVKYDRQPMRFTFEFYRPQDAWRVFSFSYDDNFDDELEEAAKLNNLNQ